MTRGEKIQSTWIYTGRAILWRRKVQREEGMIEWSKWLLLGVFAEEDIESGKEVPRWEGASGKREKMRVRRGGGGTDGGLYSACNNRTKPGQLSALEPCRHQLQRLLIGLTFGRYRVKWWIKRLRRRRKEQNKPTRHSSLKSLSSGASWHRANKVRNNQNKATILDFNAASYCWIQGWRRDMVQWCMHWWLFSTVCFVNTYKERSH